MAHVLFMDIVAYSRLPMGEQHKLVGLLQQTVQSTAAFSKAREKQRLVCLPTGDGMALVFFGDPEAPVRCAVDLARMLREHPELKLRMGIHTGPVYRVADINANLNVAGGGINMAQRVMDCGDEGHILVSEVVADMLAQLGKWEGCVHDLGVAEVKHGVRIHVYNLHTQDAGNPQRPRKLDATASHPPPSSPTSPLPTPPAPGRGIDPAHLESVTKELAAFIGPIAKVVVRRASERCSSVDELYSTCAAEIESEKDRARFLATRKQLR